nr:MBL fold metallo-hydrolase [Halomonas sp.]
MSLSYEVLVEGNNIKLDGGFLGLSTIVLVEANSKKILIDTGHHVTRMMLMKALDDRGISPDEIDIVFLTHLHFDHVNNIDLFTKSKILVARTEWEYASSPHVNDHFIPSHIQHTLAELNLEIYDGEPEITTGVRAISTPGHTPGHMSILLESKELGAVVIAGDAIKYPKETLTKSCDLAFDTIEIGSKSIVKLMKMADCIVPGHFPPLYKIDEERFVWKDGASFNLVIR